MNISSLINPAANTQTASSLSPQITTAKPSVRDSTGNAPLTVGAEPSSLQDKQQAALQIVNRTLVSAYEKISSRGQAASAEYETFEPLTAEKVANNILGFIERRLQLDAAEGATQEELQARLEAGLSGFKKGFAEASEKLEALSLLSPEIKADIGKTYDLVLESIDALRAKFIQSTDVTDNVKSEAQAPQVIKTADNKVAATKLDVPQFLPATSSYLGYGNYEYGHAREFSFELTTKEGDKVTIKATSSEGFAAEAASAGRGNNSVSAFSGSYASSQSFSLAIEGELNEAELGAINDLLGQVNKLASEFFEGDLDIAFDQALNMGYDAEQIGSFSLNLAEAEIQQVTQAYQTFEPSRADGAANPQLLADQLLPLGNFIKDLLASLERAAAGFPEPQPLIATMAEKITGETELDQQQGKRFRDFMEKLFALDLG